jgi:phospholipid transport system substrate-binding protein
MPFGFRSLDPFPLEGRSPYGTTPNEGEDFSINYKLHLINADWKVYDIVIENISLVNNYRSQFNRVIVQSSFEDLVRIMKEK